MNNELGELLWFLMQRASFLHDRTTPWETPTVQNRKLKATFWGVVGEFSSVKLCLSVRSKKRLLSICTNRLVRPYVHRLRDIRIVFLRNSPIHNCNNNYKCVKRLFKIRSNCQAVANFGVRTWVLVLIAIASNDSYAQTRQSLRCSHTQSLDVDEDSDQN